MGPVGRAPPGDPGQPARQSHFLRTTGSSHMVIQAIAATLRLPGAVGSAAIMGRRQTEYPNSRLPMNATLGSAPIPRPALALARYRLRFRARDPEDGASLDSLRNAYLGSAWRGAFGHALRRSVCVTRLPACDPCTLLRSCPYPFLFESRTPPDATKLTRYPRTPGPFVLEPADRHFDTRSGPLNLGVTLFGSANNHLPYFVHALDRAGRHGLTAKRVELAMVDVQAESQGRHAGDDIGDATERDGWTTIFEPGGPLSPVPARPPVVPAPPAAVRIRLLSPLRIKRHGHLVGVEGFDFRAFMGGLLRRISLLTYFFGDTPLETDFAGLLGRAESIPALGRDLHWREWTRYSSRQNAKLQMGGLVGSFELARPALDPLWPILWLGQWTHAGKGGSMGLGRYVIEPLPAVESRDTREGKGAVSEPGGESWPAPCRL